MNKSSDLWVTFSSWKLFRCALKYTNPHIPPQDLRLLVYTFGFTLLAGSKAQ
jgi:hypothetical protein